MRRRGPQPAVPEPTPSRFGSARVVLGDSSLAVHFAKGGGIAALLDFLGDRLQVARDVLDELRRLVVANPALEAFVRWAEADEEARVAPLSIPGVQKALDLARVLQLPGDHERAHVGECATIVVAEEMCARGVVVLVCMDDGEGKRLARRARLEVGDTPELLIEMVCAGALDAKDGAHLWRRGLFPDRRDVWAAYWERLRSHGFSR